jgi:membrane-bound serine protease (ClpP class)
VIATALFFFFVVGAAVKAQRRKVTTGESAIVGSEAVTLSKLNPTGQVRYQGETWSAESVEGTIEKNATVIVTEIRGLLLKVRKQ